MDEKIFKELIGIARQVAPTETAKVEDWLYKQAKNYAAIRAKEEASKLAQTVQASPITPFLIGGLIAFFIFKR